MPSEYACFRCEGQTTAGETVTLYCSTHGPQRAVRMFLETCDGEGLDVVAARVFTQEGRTVLAKWEAAPE